MAVSSLEGPATDAKAVTASNTVAVTSTAGLAPRALYVGGSGNLSLTLLSGANVVFNSVPAGTFISVRPKYVLTDTTATSIVALF